MDPNHAIIFQREKERHDGAYFTTELGALYRGAVRDLLDRGVGGDGLFYMEVKNWGVSRFFVTGPAPAVQRYGHRIKAWIERIQEEERQERIREGQRLIAGAAAKKCRRDWWKGLFGFRSGQ